jgi:hypothetical protein
LTRHLTAFPTRNETTAAVIKFFKEIIPKYGLFSITATTARVLKASYSTNLNPIFQI